MISEYRIKGSLGIAGGLMCHIAGFAISNLGAPHPVKGGAPPHMTMNPVTIAAYASYIVATALLTYGCFNHLRAKGYNPWLGLLALLPPYSAIGLVIACLPPDRAPEQPPEEAQKVAHEKIRQMALRENEVKRRKPGS